MKDNEDSTRFSGINLFLLFIACLASLGTLAPDHSTGRPRALIGDWAGEPRTFELTVINGEGLVPDYDPNLVHYMSFEIADIPLDSSTESRWTLRVEGNDMFSMEGDFTIEEEGSWHMDGESVENLEVGVISVDAGTLCTPDEDVESGCIPCSLTEGCVIFIEVDLCQPLPLPEDVHIKVYIKPQEHEYEVKCHKDDDQTPCDLLDSWLSMTYTSSASDLCGSQELENGASTDEEPAR